jgi:hypothetical protein
MGARTAAPAKTTRRSDEDSTTVRISARARETVRRIAERRGETMSQVLTRAVQEEERREMRRLMAEAATRLKGNPGSWEDYRRDLADLEGTVGDHIADGEWEEEWRRRDAITW